MGSMIEGDVPRCGRMGFSRSGGFSRCVGVGEGGSMIFCKRHAFVRLGAEGVGGVIVTDVAVSLEGVGSMDDNAVIVVVCFVWQVGCAQGGAPFL